MIGLVLSVLSVAVFVFALVDIIRCESWRIAYLDKVAWVFIVILIPFIGTILWFVLGKSRDSSPAPYRTAAPQSAPVSIDQTDIDAQVEREIAFHENEARIRRLEAELKAKREIDENR